VIAMKHVVIILVSSNPKNVNELLFCLTASIISLICIAITDNTSTRIRLNSSNVHHAPVPHSPLKNLHMAMWSIELEQFMTTHWIASAFARSFTDSVLPVPAGPSGPPP